MSAAPLVVLREVAQIDRSVVEASAIQDGTLYVGLENINSGGELKDVAPVAAGDLASNKFTFTSRHLLFGKLRPNLAKVARPDFEGICSTDILPILPGPKLERDYLAHLLLTPRMVGWATERAAGANLPRLSPQALAELLIPLPPMEQQRKIAGILNATQSVRAKRRAALALLDTFPQAMFAEIFGAPDQILTRWSTSILGNQLEFLTSGSRGWAEFYREKGELFIRIQNVRRDRLVLDDVAYVSPPDSAEARRTRVQAGDVLMSITADLGRTAVVPDGINAAYISQHLAILRSTSFVPRFLSAYLTSPAGQHQVLRRNRQAVKAGLNFDDIRALVVPLPPMDRQREFARRVDAADRVSREQGVSLRELDTLFVSFQHRAFDGPFWPASAGAGSLE